MWNKGARRKVSAVFIGLLRDEERRGSVTVSYLPPETAVLDSKDRRKGENTCPFFNRYVIVVMVLLVLLATGLLCWFFISNSSERKRPHVLLLIADDLGWADVGWHSSDIVTPTLTELAQNGIILTQFYSQPICTASRAALLTGRYPFKLGLQGSRPILAGAEGSLPLENTLLPQLMKDAGYKTHMCGKWHLGYETIRHTPVMRGFDTFTGFYNGMQDYFAHETSGFDKVNGVGGYDMRRDYLDPDGSPVINNVLWSANGTYNSYIFTEEATNIISSHADNSPDDPLFLVMSYANPHSPIQVPDEFLHANDHIENDIRRTYAGLVYAMDSSVANITSALKERDMFQDTIVIFISDNGGSLSDHTSMPTGSSNFPLKGDKGGLWEAGSRVPAFIVGHGIQSGQVLEELVHITDIFPTLASYLHLDLSSVKQNLDGVDQSKLLQMESTESKHEYIVYDIDPVYRQAAIRYGDWKLILGPPAVSEVDGRYEPLKGNETSYENSGLPMQQYVTKVMSLIAGFRQESDKSGMCSTVLCFYPDGYRDEVLLYDLSTDEFEFQDLSAAHPEIVDKLIAIIDREMVEMIAPVNLLLPANPAASPTNFDGTWMPWLP